MSYLNAKRLSLSDISRKLETKRVWASAGEYLNKSTLKTLARCVSGCELPDEFVQKEHLKSEEMSLETLRQEQFWVRTSKLQCIPGIPLVFMMLWLRVSQLWITCGSRIVASEGMYIIFYSFDEWTKVSALVISHFPGLSFLFLKLKWETFLTIFNLYLLEEVFSLMLADRLHICHFINEWWADHHCLKISHDSKESWFI